MVKKMLLTALCASIALAKGGFVEERGNYYEDYKNDARYERPEHRITSVARALKMRDNTKVMMDGRIVKHLRDDDYIFVDKRGDEMIVEIDDDEFEDHRIDRRTLIRIYGEIDIDDGRKKVDVDEVRVLRW